MPRQIADVYVWATTGRVGIHDWRSQPVSIRRYHPGSDAIGIISHVFMAAAIKGIEAVQVLPFKHGYHVRLYE